MSEVTPYYSQFFIRPGINRGNRQRKHTHLFFTASWHDSLFHPVLGTFSKLLSSEGIDALSIDLPFHYKGGSYDESLKRWQDEARYSHLFIDSYIEQTANSLFDMEREGKIDLTNFSISGLSRGAYIAVCLIEKIQKTIPILLFAPMLDIQGSMYKLSPSQIPNGSPLFMSTGNNDTRIGTEKSVAFYQEYTKERQAALQKQGISTKPADTTLFIHPSIGFMGHGTTDETFLMASSWILSRKSEREL